MQKKPQMPPRTPASLPTYGYPTASKSGPISMPKLVKVLTFFEPAYCLPVNKSSNCARWQANSRAVAAKSWRKVQVRMARATELFTGNMLRQF